MTRIPLLLVLIASILIAPASAQDTDNLLVEGTISAGGVPLEGLDVVLNMAMGENYVPILNVTTDSEGRFGVYEDLLDHVFLVEFQYEGITHIDAFVSTNDTYTTNFNLSGSVEFTVLGVNGGGVEGVHVNLINQIGYSVGHAVTDSSGSGTFENLNIGASYMVSIEYAGVPYSDVFDLVNSSTAGVELQVLETTTSDEDIEAYMHHVVVEMEEEYLSIWEGLTYRNLGDAIFNNSWLKIWIPPDAEEVDSDVMDCCVQTTDEGIMIDPMDPIFPESTFETKVEYRIKAKSTKQVLTAKMDYDTPSFLFLIEKVSGVTVENPVGLTFDSERDLGGTAYLIYRGVDVTAGETVSVQLSGLVSWTDIILRNPIVWLGGLMLAPAALLVYFFVLKKDGRTDEPETPRVKPVKEVIKASEPKGGELSEIALSGEDLEAERTALKSVLDKIEDDHRNDVIDDSTYRSLKAKYSERLDEIDAEFGDSQQADELEDLRAEEVAIRSVLDKIASDHDKGLLSERAYNRLKDRYEERLTEIMEMLGKSQ